jgi:putative transferase (TIGR04331 family)
MINYLYDKETQTKIFINNFIIEFFPRGKEKNIFTKLWEDEKILDQHSFELTKLYKDIISKLKDILNDYHNIEKSEKYWEICFGYWLWRFIVNYFEKWKSIEKFLSENKKKLIFYQTNFNNLDFLFFGIDDYIYMDNTEEFNTKVLNEIIREINDPNIELKIYDSISFLKKAKLIREKVFRKKNKNLLKKALFKKNNSNLKKVFYNTKLSFFDSLIVNLKLGQGFTLFPNNLNLRDIISNEKFEPDLKFRSIKYNFYKTDLENFIFNKVIEKIPILFLESYKNQNLLLQTFNLPKNPQLIATANGFQGSTIYSQYIANKVEEGSKLYIFQHGGSYGQFKNHFASEFETRLADKFFTWGWRHNKEIPFYSLKKINMYKKNKNRNKILLELRSNSSKPKSVEISESKYQGYSYYIECLKFFEIIKNTQIEKDLLIKLSPRQFDYDEKKSFLKVNENLLFADRNIDMIKTREISKLLIFTTISTGHLEAVATNYPFLILNVYPDVIKDRYKFIFKKMENLNLLHSTGQSLFNTIRALPPDIYKWWQSSQIQDFLVEYRSLFARYDQKNRINLFCEQLKD